jgi:hypothetical protein
MPAHLILLTNWNSPNALDFAASHLTVVLAEPFDNTSLRGPHPPSKWAHICLSRDNRSSVATGSSLVTGEVAKSFWWAHPPGGEEIAAMFGSFALGPMGYVALMLVCAAVTLLTGLVLREIVIRHLRTLP